MLVKRWVRIASGFKIAMECRAAPLLFLLALVVLPFLAATPLRAETAMEGSGRVGVPPHAVPTTGLQGIAFASNGSCVGCHPKQASSWRGSHHDLAMQEATVQSVLGDFEEALFTQGGRSFRFFKGEGNDFRVQIQDGEGPPEEHRIAYTFGVHPLQQYLIQFPGGRLQALTVVFDVEKNQWYSLYPDETVTGDPAFSLTGRYQNWNVMCAECHSTAFEKNYDPKTDTYSSTWAEINVSCQSCHGPGEQHVLWAQSGADPKVQHAGLVGALAEGQKGAQVETCAACHSRRHSVSPSDTIGGAFLDDFVPETLDEGLYESDGQILEEVYVYGSFLQSRMHASGVTCIDCHDPHSLDLALEGDALCIRCHGPEPDVRFPQLAKRRYDTVDHHGHEASSSAARCVTCHMPTRTYMGVDERHDHAFQVPRPDLAAELGIRDVCTECHQGKTAAWAARVIAERHGPERKRGPDWAPVIDSARKGQLREFERLSGLTRPGAAPDIVRATAVKLIGRYGPLAEETLAQAAQDPSPLVRHAAASVYAQRPEAEKLEVLPALLSDPLRAVRVEAGRALVSVNPESLGEENTALRDESLLEYKRTQESLSDLPMGSFNQAVLQVEEGDYAEARSSYARAIEMDPRFLPAVANLAQLESALGQGDRAEDVLRSGLEDLPQEGELHYSLGLLLAQKGDRSGSAAALGEAASLMPDRPRVQYNHGLAEQHLGHVERAAAAFQKASEMEPLNPTFLRALTILYAQNGRWLEADGFARRLAEVGADSPENRALFRRIQSELQRRGE